MTVVGRTRKPSKVTGRVCTPTPRGVKTKFTYAFPNTWDNGEVFDRADLDYFKVTLKRLPAGGSWQVVDTVETKSLTNFFALQKSEFVAWKENDFKILVAVIPVDGEEIEDTQGDMEAGSGTNPESGGADSFAELTGTVSEAQIGIGAVTYAKISADMPAAAPTVNIVPSLDQLLVNGIDQYPPRSYIEIVESPNPTYKNGDWRLNIGESPARVYKREVPGAGDAHRWYKITDNPENIYADNIVAGTITGILLRSGVGGGFETAVSADTGDYIRISDADRDVIGFYHNATRIGMIKKNSAEPMLIKSGATGDAPIVMIANEVRVGTATNNVAVSLANHGPHGGGSATIDPDGSHRHIVNAHGGHDHTIPPGGGHGHTVTLSTPDWGDDSGAEATHTHDLSAGFHDHGGTFSSGAIAGTTTTHSHTNGAAHVHKGRTGNVSSGGTGTNHFHQINSGDAASGAIESNGGGPTGDAAGHTAHTHGVSIAAISASSKTTDAGDSHKHSIPGKSHSHGGTISTGNNPGNHSHDGSTSGSQGSHSHLETPGSPSGPSNQSTDQQANHDHAT